MRLWLLASNGIIYYFTKHCALAECCFKAYSTDGSHPLLFLFVVFCFMLRKIIGNFFPYIMLIVISTRPRFCGIFSSQFYFFPFLLLFFFFIFGRALRFNCPRLRSCLGLFVIYVTISVNRA